MTNPNIQLSVNHHLWGFFQSFEHVLFFRVPQEPQVAARPVCVAMAFLQLRRIAMAWPMQGMTCQAPGEGVGDFPVQNFHLKTCLIWEQQCHKPPYKNGDDWGMVQLALFHPTSTQHSPKRFNRLTHQSTKDIGPAVGMTIPLTLAATQNT